AHQGHQAHVIQGTVFEILVLVEDHFRVYAAEPALEGEQVVSQGEDGNRVTEAAQGAGHHADHLAEVLRAGTVLRQFRHFVLGAVVDQGNVKSLHNVGQCKGRRGGWLLNSWPADKRDRLSRDGVRIYKALHRTCATGPGPLARRASEEEGSSL